MSNISLICDNIVARLTDLGSPIAALLMPGATLPEIAEVEQSLGISLPDSAREMYLWRNGTKLEQGACLFPWWTFDSLEESHQRYQVLVRDPISWSRSLFPLFSSSDISSIGILCGNLPVQDAQIECYEHSLGRSLEYENIASMLNTILSALEAGVITVTATGDLDYDKVEFARIAQKLNPDVAKWCTES